MQVSTVDLAHGNVAEAQKFFQECIDDGLFVDGNYWYAKHYLAMMEADPDWPGWIPPKPKH
jgi:hypothetical protein